MHGAHGFAPDTEAFPASGALAKGLPVGFDSNGQLAIAQGATITDFIGITKEAAAAQGDMVLVELVSPDAILRVSKSGTAAFVAGTNYDIAADGLSVNGDDTTNPKVKVLGLWPGETALYKAINIAYGL